MAQQTEPDIQKLAAQSKAELKWQEMHLSPQRILYRIEDGHEQILVPQSLRRKIMEEHHNVQVIGLVGMQRIVDHIKMRFLVVRLMGRCQTVRAILSSLSVNEIGRQEKGGFATTYSPAGKKMATDYDRFGRRFSRV